jgi:hypothetical protein
MQSALYTGRLEHRRHEPVPHAFSYSLTLCWLDLAELDAVFRGRWLWSVRRPAPVRFRRADYFGDPGIPLDSAVRDRVAQETGHRPVGPIRMLANLRSFGVCFNPVSFYYCYDAEDTRVEAIVAEITNTPWNERHAYVLSRPDAPATGRHLLRFNLAKDFHVSPFMPMDMDYDWRFTPPGATLGVHMVNRRSGRRVFDAVLALRRQEITGASLASALLRQPCGSMSALLRIYWQALRLWSKRTPFHVHPASRAPERST